MRRVVGGVVLALILAPALAADSNNLGWAFYFPDANQPQNPPDTQPKQLEGSTRSYTMAQINDLKNPPDWFPDAHPPMPRVVAQGAPGPVGFACASCHLTSGMGHPESSSLAGLTAAYMERQIADFKSGARKQPIMVNGQPQNNATQFMVAIAKGLSEEDSKAAAAYFASLKPVPNWVRVVEQAQVPRTYVTLGYMRLPIANGGQEPIGNRIVEIPENVPRELLRDPRSGTVAYVPPGSIARGRTLATTGGGGKTVPCTVCHGPELKGVADIPHIAGRSPLYAFRQLHSFKDGSRGGNSAALMVGVVAQLTDNDMIDLAAYVATLTP